MSGDADGISIFFDLGQTLGFECRSTETSSQISFQAYSDIPARLEELRRDGHRLGVLTSGRRWTADLVAYALHSAGLDDYFDSALTAHWTTDSVSHFESAVAHAQGPCLFVSADRGRRKLATSAGMKAVAHPALTRAVARGDKVVLLRVAGRIRSHDRLVELCRTQPFAVPLRIYWSMDDVILYAAATEQSTDSPRMMTTPSARTRFEADDLRVERFGESLAIETAQLYSLDPTHTPHDPTSLRRIPTGTHIVYKGNDAIVVAINFGEILSDPQLLGCCGNALRLEPRLSLLAEKRSPALISTFSLDATDTAAISGLTVKQYQDYLNPWWHETDVEKRNIRSRDIRHPHNEVAAKAATALLAEICGEANVRLCPFPRDASSNLYNIEATIPADPHSAHKHEVVILGAHLDSINAEVDTYARQDAPGVNDDASGIAGVLSAAHVLTSMMNRRPMRTIRLLLFNAEEDNLLGSIYYSDNHASGDLIAAMFQLDMIGHINPDLNNRTQWEVHTGIRSGLRKPEERRVLQTQLGDIVELAAKRLAPALTLQRYPIKPGCHDGGATRSDHASFNCPACKICENFYQDDCPGEAHPKHPTYHSLRDTIVDYDFATQITRAAIGAVWMRANAT